MTHIKPEDIFNIKSVSSPKVIPNTNHVLYYVTKIREDENDYVTHLYVNDGEENHQLTFGDERISSVKFSNDGKYIFFMSLVDKKQQIFRMRLIGGEREQITFEKEGVTGFEVSKDDDHLYYGVSIEVKKLHAETDEESKDEKDAMAETDGAKKDKKKDLPEPVVIDRMKYKFDGVGVLKEKYAEIKVLDLNTLDVDGFVSKDKVNYNVKAVGSSFILYTSDESDNPDFNFSSTLFLKEGDDVKEIETAEGYVATVSISPDEKHIAIAEISREFENATHPKLFIYDIENDKKIGVTDDLDRPVGGMVAADMHQSAENDGVVWIDDKTFLFIVADYGSVNLYRGTVDGKIEAILEDAHEIYGLSANKNHAFLAISTPTRPGEIYRLDLKTNSLEALTTFNKEFVENHTIVAPEEIVFNSKDGTEVHGWIMKPAEFKSDKKYPMVTNIHGGPHALYGNTFFHEMQVLASKGYGVLYVNPRGSHSYSQAFVDAVRGDYGGGDYEDIMAGVDYAVANFDWVDEDNLGVTGGSYGGFMTNWIVGHTDRFKAAVTQRSICNWTSFRGVSDIGYYFTDWQIKAEFTDIEKMWHHSPIKYVNEMKTPLLILHSEHDYRCPMEQAEQLYIALKYNGVRTRLVRFPEADHNLSRSGKPNLRIKRLEHLTEWFDNILG